MENIIISTKIKTKLTVKHCVDCNEVAECFSNHEGEYLTDSRAKHASNPQTLWFISETTHGRMLKVVFIYDDGKIFLRTAYPPDPSEVAMYRRLTA